MKKAKLKLENIEIESFVTNLSPNLLNKKIGGQIDSGTPCALTENNTCNCSVDKVCSVDEVCSIDVVC